MEDETNDVDVLAAEETPEAELTPQTDWEAEAKKARGIAQRALTKLKKIGESKPEKVEPTIAPVKQTQTSDGLDETQLDYLDLKGISEDEDVKIIEDIVKKTGQTVRQALKDDYVVAKLAANKETRELRAATPGDVKRAGGGGGNDLAVAIAKYEQSGFNPASLPTDFALQTAVIDAITARGSSNKPAWHS